MSAEPARRVDPAEADGPPRGPTPLPPVQAAPPVPIPRQPGYPNLLRPPKGSPSPNTPEVQARTKLKKRSIIEYLDEELEEMALKQGLERHEAGRLLARKWLHHIFKKDDKALLIECLMRRDGAVAVKVKQEIDVVSKRLEHMFGEIIGGSGSAGSAVVASGAEQAVAGELERRAEAAAPDPEPEGEAGPRDVEVEPPST